MDILRALRAKRWEDSKKLILNAKEEDLQFHKYEWVRYSASNNPEFFIDVIKEFPDWKSIKQGLISVAYSTPCRKYECDRYQYRNTNNMIICFEFLVTDSRSLPFRGELVRKACLLLYDFCDTIAKHPELYQYVRDENLFDIWLLNSNHDVLTYLRKKPGIVAKLADKVMINGYFMGFCTSECRAVLSLPEVVIDMNLINKFNNISFYNAIIGTGRLGDCAGRRSNNPLIEVIWERIKDKQLSGFNLILFYGLRVSSMCMINILPEHTPKLFTRPWYTKGYLDYEKHLFIRYLLLQEIIIVDIARYAIGKLL